MHAEPYLPSSTTHSSGSHGSPITETLLQSQESETDEEEHHQQSDHWYRPRTHPTDMYEIGTIVTCKRRYFIPLLFSCHRVEHRRRRPIVAASVLQSRERQMQPPRTCLHFMELTYDDLLLRHHPLVSGEPLLQTTPTFPSPRNLPARPRRRLMDETVFIIPRDLHRPQSREKCQALTPVSLPDLTRS